MYLNTNNLIAIVSIRMDKTIDINKQWMFFIKLSYTLENKKAQLCCLNTRCLQYKYIYMIQIMQTVWIYL